MEIFKVIKIHSIQVSIFTVQMSCAWEKRGMKIDTINKKMNR